MTDLRSTIPALIARRQTVGASSPEGRRLSLLIEQIENGETLELDAKIRLAGAMTQTLAELDQIRRDGGRYVHEHHGHSKGAM